MNIKRSFALILPIFISLVSCGPSSQPTTQPSVEPSISTIDPTTDPTTEPSVDPTQPSLTNEEKTLQILSNFDVLNTNGFDYSIKQSYKNTITNSYYSVLRIQKSEESLIASKVENSMELNSDITGDLYKEITLTSYFNNNKIGTLVDDVWNWKDGLFTDFVDVKISEIDFSKTSLLEETINEGTENTYSFRLSDNDNYLVMNEENLTNVRFEIVVDSSYSQLISFKVNFDQKLTNSEISLIPYYGKTNVVLP